MSNLRRHQRLFHSSDFNSRPSQLWKWSSLLAAHFCWNCSNVRWLVFPRTQLVPLSQLIFFCPHFYLSPGRFIRSLPGWGAPLQHLQTASVAIHYADAGKNRRQLHENRSPTCPFSGGFQKSRDSAAVFLGKKWFQLRALESIFGRRFSLVELCEPTGPTLLNWRSLNRFLLELHVSTFVNYNWMLVPVARSGWTISGLEPMAPSQGNTFAFSSEWHSIGWPAHWSLSGMK